MKSQGRITYGWQISCVDSQWALCKEQDIAYKTRLYRVFVILKMAFDFALGSSCTISRARNLDIPIDH